MCEMVKMVLRVAVRVKAMVVPMILRLILMLSVRWTNRHKNYCDSRVTLVPENPIFGVKIQNESSFLILAFGLKQKYFRISCIRWTLDWTRSSTKTMLHIFLVKFCIEAD